ncbi:DUF2946 domain-containing protein [Massilia niabensis]|uniref:DUF2946 domain-containing protein n=1 Tax=Massilia niabensis TaxID=544910 RepID=A0ABW0KXU5_9BURK
MTRLLRHALINWIACLTILFGTLAPSLSHAVHTPPEAVDFPVCHAAGHTATEVNATGVDLGVDPVKHCPFCSDGHHAPDLLPQTSARLAAVGGAVFPSLFYRAPEPLFHWAATRSRAPPVVS